MQLTDRLDAFQRRHSHVGYPLAVLYKFFDDGGGHLAALITYYAFLSLFPLLLLASTVLALVLQGDPGAQHAALSSVLAQFPVIGEQLAKPQHLSGGTAAVVIGVLGALYGGLGVGVAGQAAMNTIWSVPRNNRPNPFKARGRALLLLTVVGVAVVLTTTLSVLGGGAGDYDPALRAVLLAGSVLVNVVAFTFAFRVATARPLTVRDVLPGALTAALAWQVLQLYGKAYVTHTVMRASDTNSVFALVLGMLAFLYLTALTVVLSSEANAVRVDRLYPRSLLTPLTDDVDLTAGDERAYRDQAQAQRSKGFEVIDVRFDEHA